MSAQSELEAAQRRYEEAQRDYNSKKGGRIVGPEARARRQARRELRRAQRALEKAKAAAQKEDNLSLGSSKEDEKRYLDEAREARLDTQEKSEETRGKLSSEAEQQDLRSRDLDFKYEQARNTAVQGLGTLQDSVNALNPAAAQASGIVQNAYGTNQLTGTTENARAQRDSALAGQPSLGALANQAMAAQQAQMQNQTNFAQGQLARQAMGVAAGQGEGGALAAQQALAGLTQAGGNIAVQNNLALSQQAADMRAAAAMGTRQEAMDTANLGLNTRLAAAAQERQNQLAAAGKSADLVYGAAKDTNTAQTGYQNAAQNEANTSASAAAAGNSAALGALGALAGFDTAREGMATDKELGLVGAEAGVGTTAQQMKPPKDRPGWAQLAFPLGMLGPQPGKDTDWF